MLVAGLGEEEWDVGAAVEEEEGGAWDVAEDAAAAAAEAATDPTAGVEPRGPR